MVKKIEIEVTGDTRNLERALSNSQKKTKSWEKSLSSAAKGGAIALAGLGVAAAYSVKSASNLEEQINKTSVVFRGSEKTIHKWSQSTASSLGISQRAALEAAGTFGNMLVPMGLARDKAGQMSTKMVELAADMASFNNASPEDVLEALRSGLSGETEPLRKFGVFLNQARIEQEAVTLGLKKGKEELTASAKAQATYSIILKDTTDAQGDFGRTSDSLANQQRILRAELEDTAAQLGQALIPAATGAASALLDLVNVVKENEEAAKAVAIGIAALSAGLIVANASLKIYTSATLVAIGATKGLRLAMATTPWGLAAVAAAGLVTWLISQKDKTSDAESAQRGLTDSLLEYQDAVRAGKNARIDLEAANLRLERAEINVKQAVNDRRAVEKDSTSTLLDRREADLRVAEALNERRRAEMSAKDATKAGTDAQWKQNLASEKLAGQFSVLTAKYQDNTTEQRKVHKSGRDVQGTMRLVAIQTGAASDNAHEYAGALRNMADSARVNNPKLARTADLAANLADAWGRVVSLPAAREFVARFSVFTTVETNRQIPRQAGGPVTAGQAYIVGEKRPELFVPNQSGTILPSVPDSGTLAERITPIMRAMWQAGSQWFGATGAPQVRVAPGASHMGYTDRMKRYVSLRPAIAKGLLAGDDLSEQVAVHELAHAAQKMSLLRRDPNLAEWGAFLFQQFATGRLMRRIGGSNAYGHGHKSADLMKKVLGGTYGIKKPWEFMLRDQFTPQSLDSGGTVTRTGLAKVHRGETFSGVSNGSSGPGQFALIYAGPDFIGYLRNEAARWQRTNGKAAF